MEPVYPRLRREVRGRMIRRMLPLLLLACRPPAPPLPGGRLEVALDGVWEGGGTQRDPGNREFEGTAVVARTVVLPEGWSPDTRAVLRGEWTGWLVRVAVDDTEVGRDRGGLRPVAIDLTGHLHAGANRIVVSAAPPDATNIIDGTTVEGLSAFTYGQPAPGDALVGRLWLELSEGPSIDTLTTRLTGDTLVATAQTGARAGETVTFRIMKDGQLVTTLPDATVDAEGRATTRMTWNGPRWSPADPALGWLVARVGADGPTRAVRFGPRAIARDATGLTVNGSETYLSVLRWPLGVFPERAEVARYARAYGASGINALEFHVSKLTTRTLDMLDELGFYAVVTPVCDGFYRRDGPPAPAAEWSAFVAASNRRILDAFDTHPSVALWHVEGGDRALHGEAHAAYADANAPQIDGTESGGLEVERYDPRRATPYWNEFHWSDPTQLVPLFAAFLASHRPYGVGVVLPPEPLASSLRQGMAEVLGQAGVSGWPGGPRRGPATAVVQVLRGGAAVNGAVVVLTPEGQPAVASATDETGTARIELDYAGAARVGLLGAADTVATTLRPGTYMPAGWVSKEVTVTLTAP